MRSLPLHFTGPLTFTSGDLCLFESPLRDAACIYLWTIQSDRDRRFYIHYVGETQAFAERQREHLVHILGLDYGIFDPAQARLGVQSLVWPGLWRDKSPEGPSRALEHYARVSMAVLDYVSALAIFAAAVQVDVKLRRHIEGSIGWNLREQHRESAVLYPDDNRVAKSSSKVSLRLEVSSDEPIAGLDHWLEV